MSTRGTRFSRRTFLTLVAVAAMSTCTVAAAKDKDGEGWWTERDGGAVVRGSGRIVSEPRAVTPFQAVHLRGAMKLVLRQGTKEAVEVRGDDNLLSLVETTVISRGGVPTLEIGSKRNASYTTRNRIVVTVDVVTLKALAITGAGDAEADGLKAGELNVHVAGSGDLRLRRLSADSLGLKLSGSGDVAASGRAGTLAVSIAGSGDVAARELEADDVTVSIAGSGDARVNARRTLSVSVAGSGDVEYTGDATVRSSIAGSGNVTKR